MKYFLATFLIVTSFACPVQAAKSADEYAETHQTTSFGEGEVMPRYLLLTAEQKQKFIRKNKQHSDSRGDYMLYTYQDLFRLSPVVFRGRILLDQADKDKASVSIQRIYKGKEQDIPKLIEIDDRDCLDHYIMGNNFVIFLEAGESAPTMPDFCNLEIQEVYHPAMQYLDKWEKGIPYDR